MKINPNGRSKSFTKRLLNDFSTELLELLQEKQRCPIWTFCLERLKRRVHANDFLF